MSTHRVKRALEIIKKDGPTVFCRKSIEEGKKLFKRSMSDPIVQWWKYDRYHETPLDPCHHIWINPNNIYLAKRVPINKNNWNLSHVLGGNWDQEKMTIEDNAFRRHRKFDTNILYHSLYNHFKKGTDWQDTELFNAVVHGDLHWRDIQTKAEFKARCEFVDRLFEDMQTNGYRTYQQIHDRQPKKPEEIKVMIGRNGCFFFVDGKHRLLIAKILELDEVAVNVIVRHKQWQDLRSAVYEHGIPESHEKLRNHPDIQDVTT